MHWLSSDAGHAPLQMILMKMKIAEMEAKMRAKKESPAAKPGKAAVPAVAGKAPTTSAGPAASAAAKLHATAAASAPAAVPGTGKHGTDSDAAAAAAQPTTSAPPSRPMSFIAQSPSSSLQFAPITDDDGIDSMPYDEYGQGEQGQAQFDDQAAEAVPDNAHAGSNGAVRARSRSRSHGGAGERHASRDRHDKRRASGGKRKSPPPASDEDRSPRARDVAKHGKREHKDKIGRRRHASHDGEGNKGKSSHRSRKHKRRSRSRRSRSRSGHRKTRTRSPDSAEPERRNGRGATEDAEKTPTRRSRRTGSSVDDEKPHVGEQAHREGDLADREVTKDLWL